MNSTPFAFRKHLAGAAMVLVAVTALSGCGGGSDDYRAPPGTPTAPVTPPVTPPVVPPPPVSMVDSFFTYVSNLAASLLDNTEPVSIDAAVITTPENTEPEPVTVAN